MLKTTVKRGLMLDFIPDEIHCDERINEKRIFNLNNNKIQNGDIFYLPTRELRFEDNWAVIFGLDLAKKSSKNFKIIIIKNLINYSNVQKNILEEGLNFFNKNSALKKISFEFLDKIPSRTGALIVDFNPVNSLDKLLKNLDCACFEVDSHNIMPARYISNKQEYSAAILRKKIYGNIAEFLTEYPISNDSQVKKKLGEFIKERLDNYAEFKNNPTIKSTSELSPYLHFGLISAQRIALEVLKSNASRENKEAFLEELIVRKELADNFCLYNSNHKSLKGLAEWAQNSLNKHKLDIRTYLYSNDDFEKGKTHDNLWNKIQQILLKTGKIHGYLRMYWAKKILEWSKTPDEALKTAVYLNDEYALDGNDSNGYVGILWSIGGLHDRAFSERPVFGKIRYMSLEGCKKKFDVGKYLQGY